MPSNDSSRFRCFSSAVACRTRGASGAIASLAMLGAVACATSDGGAAPNAVASGSEDYQRYCAACHGPAAEGNGPAAAALRLKPADLTRIAARRGGVFPEAEILRIIDGRDPVVAHGSSAMPVWGRTLGEGHRSGPAKDATSRGIALHIIEYLKAIQAK